MSRGTKVRTPARRYNMAEVAEILRVAAWYDGIAADYAAGRAHRRGLRVLDDLVLFEQQAKQEAARLRAKAAAR